MSDESHDDESQRQWSIFEFVFLDKYEIKPSYFLSDEIALVQWKYKSCVEPSKVNNAFIAALTSAWAPYKMQLLEKLPTASFI